MRVPAFTTQLIPTVAKLTTTGRKDAELPSAGDETSSLPDTSEACWQTLHKLFNRVRQLLFFFLYVRDKNAYPD